MIRRISIWTFTAAVSSLFVAASATQPADSPPCALIPFQNLNGQPQSAYVAAVIEEALHPRLRDAGRWQLLERARIAALLAESEAKAAGLIAGEPAQLAGADLLILGEYRDDAGLVTVAARLVRADTGEVLRSAEWTGHVSGLSDDMAPRVAAMLAEQPPPTDELDAKMQDSFAKACRHLAKDRIDRAIQACNTILDEHPRDVATLLLRGHAELRKKGWDRYAAKDFQRILEIDDENIAARIGLARTKLGTDSRAADQALELVEDVLSEHPDHGEALIIAARIHIQARRQDQALEAAIAATRALPQYAPAWRTLGRLHLDRSAHAEALRCAQTAVECHPSDPYAWTLLGDAQRAAGLPADSTLSFRKALECDPPPDLKTQLDTRLHERG